MSAWGTGPFENDEAAAWCDDLDTAPDAVAFAAQTLRSDDEEAGRVIAAAAWFVAGLPGTATPPDGPQTPPVPPDADLADDAVEALGRALRDDHWVARHDPEDRDRALAYVRSLVETWEVAVG